MDVKKYLNEHSAKEIKIGQSGADVYEIDGKYVLKHVIRQKLKEEQFITYTREALFYQNQMTRQRIYLPVVLKAETSQNEILILMKKYYRPERNAINAELIQKICQSWRSVWRLELFPEQIRRSWHPDRCRGFLGFLC